MKYLVADFKISTDRDGLLATARDILCALAGEAGHHVFELGELDLYLALAGLGAQGENIEDEHGAVDDAYVGDLLDVADLDGRQLEVENDQVDLFGLTIVADLVQLAGTDAGGGVEALELLRDGCDRLGAGALGQLKQLGERRLGVVAAGIDLDEQGADGLNFGDGVFHKNLHLPVDLL